MESDRELEAMAAIAKALTDMDQDTITRVLRWVSDRYRVKMIQPPDVIDRANNQEANLVSTPVEQIDNVASFFDAASPQTTADKALVVAYWLQKQGQSDFGAQEVNTELKHLGHGINNITDVLAALINQSPRLVIQKQKMGNTRQARKRYMVTDAGKKHVEGLLKLS